MDEYIKREICAKLFSVLSIHGNNEIFLRRLHNVLNAFPVVGDKPIYLGQTLNEDRNNIIPIDEQVSNMPQIKGEIFGDYGNLTEYTKTRYKV